MLEGMRCIFREPRSRSWETIREGKWKLITALGSGGFSEPKRIESQSGGPQGQLYNLEVDLGESNCLWHQEPAIVARLEKLLIEE